MRTATTALALMLASLASFASLVGLGALAGCGDSPPATQARRETAEAWAALRAYGADQREAFEQELNARIAVLDRQLDELKARSARAGASAKADIERELSELQGRRGELTLRLEELKASSKEAWVKTRDATLAAFDQLTDGINKAAGQFSDV
jgi:hypothetical protein